MNLHSDYCHVGLLREGTNEEHLESGAPYELDLTYLSQRVGEYMSDSALDDLVLRW